MALPFPAYGGDSPAKLLTGLRFHSGLRFSSRLPFWLILIFKYRLRLSRDSLIFRTRRIRNERTHVRERNANWLRELVAVDDDNGLRMHLDKIKR